MMSLRSSKRHTRLKMHLNSNNNNNNNSNSSELVNNNNNQIDKDLNLEWIDLLLTEGKIINHDAGTTEDKEERKDTIDDINENVAEAGRQYFRSNFFSLLVNMMVGLYSLMFIPSIVTVLHITGRSSSPSAAFRRYLETIRHSLTWFQDGDSLRRSMASVLRMHRAASAKSMKTKGVEMSQLDMVLTQFGFIGPYLLFPNKLGISDQNESGDRGLIYIFYLVGRSLGIQDRFNLCCGDPATVRRKCTSILHRVIQPSLVSCSDLSSSMSDHLLEGIIILNPFIIKEAFRTWTQRLLLEKDLGEETNLTGYTWINYKLQIIVFQTVMQLPGMSVFKYMFNKLLLLNLWLANDWVDLMVQQYKKSQEEASVFERLTIVVVIPVMIVRSVSAHLAKYLREKLSFSLRSFGCSASKKIRTKS